MKFIFHNQEIGKKGEDYAVKSLLNKGYKILERNFKCKSGEIDIIAKDKKEIVFIEVKTRTNLNYGVPSLAVNNSKKQHIVKVAKYYLHKYNLENRIIRFDVIEIIIKNNNFFVNHMINVDFNLQSY